MLNLSRLLTDRMRVSLRISPSHIHAQQNLSDAFVKECSDFVEVGQTVIARVLEVRRWCTYCLLYCIVVERFVIGVWLTRNARSLTHILYAGGCGQVANCTFAEAVRHVHV